MPEETLLAFDYGTQFIGVAVGNTLTSHARPLEVLGNASRDARFAQIGALIKEWQPNRLVVGLSLNVDGEEQVMSAHCRTFANQLKGRFGLPVVLVDERGTSLAAQSEMGASGRGKRVDAVAAAIILQAYFDEPPEPPKAPETPNA